MSSSVLPFVRGVDFSRIEFKNGQLQEKATEMTNLRWLRVNQTALAELPESIDKFSKLEILSVSHNNLTELHSGNIPSIQSLRVLKANHNSVRDSGIPSDLFKVKELVTVDLSHNSLSKLPEALVQAANLIVLSLSHNNISSVPGSLFVHCSGLQHLDLSNNDLQSLPPQVRRMEYLQYLDLSNNPLRHYTFKNLDKLANLTTLKLSNTGRDFTNTPHIDKLLNLTEIDMSHNELTRIPEPVYLLEGLLRVNMSHNLIKELSSLIDTWEKLVTLDVSFNLITALHINICKCVKLKRLFLANNKLTFEGIPPAIGKLSALEHFIAPRNNLECIPEGICRIYTLKRLVLTSNRLLTLPEGIHFIKLEKLDIRDNPELVLPPKPQEKVKGSGAEWYNIDFDPEILKKGAVVATSKVLKGAYTRQKERRMRMMRTRQSSTGHHDQDAAAAQKVLKGLVDVAENRDVLLAGAAVEMVPEDVATPDSPVKQKRWDQLIKRPDLDYSELFSEDVGKLPGITIWQIENFYPVEVEEYYHGQLYMGDCYIVLNTYWGEESELDWDIYYWIGRDSTLDKRACSAMHAVNLRNMLCSEHRTHREEQGEESEEFEALFTKQFIYIEGGTASGFYTVEADDIPIRLYQLCGNKRPFLEPVETVSSSLDLGYVYVLDAGKKLFVWCGTKSSLMARSKARLICEKINKFERKSHSTIVQMRAGIETEDFWSYLGGEPEVEPPLKAPHSELPAHTPIIYRAGLGTGYLELPQVPLVVGRLEKALLKTNDVYIIDFHTDIFVWIGRKSPRLVRAAALKLAQELLNMVARPPVAMVTRTQERTEHQTFKLRFCDWEDVMSVDFTKTTRMLEERAVELKKNPDKPAEKKAAKVDLSPLFLPRELPMPNREANELEMKWGSQLLSMKCCVIEGRKFSILPTREKGHFYSGECYFFLCRYAIPVEEKDPVDDEDADEEADEEDEEAEISTVVYFWQGKDTTNMGWLHFTHGIQKQLERAMDGPIDVVKLYQQQEDVKFLSHFGGKFIIHWGKRDCENANYNPSLYQIRSNGSKLCRRIVQVPARPQTLNSSFCHILKVPFENSGGSGIVYIWLGSNTNQEEAIHAEQMGRTMFESNYSNVVVKEGAEPENFFWVALGGRAAYESSAEFMNHRRLFRCSNERGFFAVSEKCIDFCQGDLSEDDVMMLDSSTNVFLWFGKNASEIERKLSVKSAQVYIKHLMSEGLGNKRKLKVAKRGQEPWEFTKCFQGWVTETEA